MTRLPRLLTFLLRQINGLFPFLYPARRYAQNFNFVRGILAYVRDYRAFAAANMDESFPLRVLDTFPCLFDRYEEAGDVPRHYFHQDLWAAKKVYESRVPVHCDFASRVDGFVAHCLVFCEVQVFDIRPLVQPIENLRFVQADITNLADVPDNSIASLSSLHAVEHIGLGRYGDPILPEGYKMALVQLERVLAPGGSLYIGVPIGRQRLEFNGHRVFDPLTIPALLTGCDLHDFAAVDDENRLVTGLPPGAFQSAAYACGLYHFVKR